MSKTYDLNEWDALDASELPEQHRAVLTKCIAEAWRNIEQNDATTEADVAADIVRHLGHEYLGEE